MEISKCKIVISGRKPDGSDSCISITQKLSAEGRLVPIVEQVLKMGLPKDTKSVKILNPKHLDQIAAKALLQVMQKNKHTASVLERVNGIINVIKGKHDGWHQSELPTAKNPWPRKIDRILSAFYLAEADANEKVRLMKHYFMTGNFLKQVARVHNLEREKVIKKLSDKSNFSDIHVRTSGVVHISTAIPMRQNKDIGDFNMRAFDHFMHIGFNVSPIVIISPIIFNPGNIGVSRIITAVCVYDERILDIPEIIEEATPQLKNHWKMASIRLLEPAIIIGISPPFRHRRTINNLIETIEKRYTKP